MSAFTPLPAVAGKTIAEYSLIPRPASFEAELRQAELRIDLINSWKIPPGSRVLEIGSGQGTCTAALAEAVGSSGHIDAVDPGPADYGAPVTLGEAQAHLSSSPVGDRITWHRAMPTDFLRQNADASWDYVVMAHCIWYYASSKDLADMLSALKARAKHFTVAEWALKASEPAAVPHLLAAITRAALEAHGARREANIRCMVSPRDIRAIAKQAGWELQEERVIVPNAGVLDGHWEVVMIKQKTFDEDVEELISEDRVKVMLRSSKEAVIAALQTAGVEKSRSMDVWVARFS